MVLRIQPWLCLFFCACSATNAFSQRYGSWRQFSTRNGLPQNSALDLEMDAAGYMWITTEGGIVRFDGQNFMRPERQNSGSGLSLRTRQIMVTAAGEMLVEDVNGAVAMIKDHDLSAVVIPPRHWIPHLGTLPDRWAYGPTVDEESTLPGRARWSRGLAQTVALDQHTWCALGVGEILVYRDSSLIDTLPVPTVLEYMFQLSGHVYGMDTTGHFLQIDLDARRVEPIVLLGAPLEEPPKLLSHGLLKADQDVGFVISSNKLYFLRVDQDPAALRSEPIDLDLPDRTIINDVIYLPAEDIIALATGTGGLFLYKPSYMQTVGCRDTDGLRSSCYSQLEVGAGVVLTAGRLISKKGCEKAELPTPVPNTGDVLRDQRGHLIFSNDARLYDFDPKSGIRVVIHDSISEEYALFALNDTVLIAAWHRIGIYANGRVSWVHTLPRTRGRDRPMVFRVGRDGSLWYGSCQGLYRCTSRNTWQFEPHPAFRGHCVRSIEFIGDRMFIGTYGQGAFVITQGQVTALPKDGHPELSEVHSFMADHDGDLWMSTNHGLVRTSLADIDRFLNTPSDRPFYAHYGEWAGIKNSEFNGGCDPGWIRMANDSVSFPTMDGLVWFRPEKIPDAYPSYPLRVEHISVDGAAVTGEGYLNLPPHVQDLTVRFSMPYWGELNNSQCEYRVTGVQDEWRMLIRGQEVITITRPPPGDFELLIRKVGSATREPGALIALPFSVRQPFLMTGSGIGLMVILSGLGMWALVELNNLRLRRRNRWLEQSVTMQTQALSRTNEELRHVVLHQEKLISIISHDVVPPLRFVARVASSARALFRSGGDPLELGETLDDLSSSTDKLFANANNLLAWIRTQHHERAPEFRSLAVHSFVDHCLDRVREMTEKQGVRLVNAVDPEDILRSDGDLLGIAVNNALLNAKLHAQASLIEVSGTRTSAGYRIIVRDDGIGIPESVIGRIRAELSGTSHHDDLERSGAAVGLGFVIIAECMRALGGTASVERAAPGTRLILHLDIGPE